LPETAKRNDRDWRLSSHHEAKYYKIAPARASHCMRFWQHWSRHCQRRNFRNTCVRRNINFECSKTWIVSCHCADTIQTRQLMLLFHNNTMQRYKGNVSCCLFQNSRIRHPAVTEFDILSALVQCWVPVVQKGLSWQPNRPPRCAHGPHWSKRNKHAS